MTNQTNDKKDFNKMTVREVWEHLTQTPWENARNLDLTTGSEERNLALLEQMQKYPERYNKQKVLKDLEVKNKKKAEFEQAFKKARAEHGPDGIFEFDGKKFNTKYKKEVTPTTTPTTQTTVPLVTVKPAIPSLPLKGHPKDEKSHYDPIQDSPVVARHPSVTSPVVTRQPQAAPELPTPVQFPVQDGTQVKRPVTKAPIVEQIPTSTPKKIISTTSSNIPFLPVTPTPEPEARKSGIDWYDEWFQKNQSDFAENNVRFFQSPNIRTNPLRTVDMMRHPYFTMGAKPLQTTIVEDDPSKKHIILHHTAGPAHESFVDSTDKNRVSAHAVIDKDGNITFYASPDQVAWGQGKSSYKGLNDMNNYSYNIEYETPTNGPHTLNPKQIAAGEKLMSNLMSTYNIPAENIISHRDVTERKIDLLPEEKKKATKWLIKTVPSK